MPEEYSNCFDVEEVNLRDSGNEAFSDLLAKIGTRTKMPKDVDKATHEKNVRDATESIRTALVTSKAQGAKISLKDALDLISDEQLDAYIKECKEAYANNTPAPYLKFYLGYGGDLEPGNDDYPYGLNAFLIPPTALSHAHTHVGKEVEDTCISWAAGKGQFQENTFECNPELDAKHAFLAEKNERGGGLNEISIRHASPEAKVTGHDAHQLQNKRGRKDLRTMITLLETYRADRGDQKAVDKMEALVGYTIHPYIGIDPDTLTSSVEKEFDAENIRGPEDIERYEKELEGNGGTMSANPRDSMRSYVGLLESQERVKNGEEIPFRQF